MATADTMIRSIIKEAENKENGHFSSMKLVHVNCYVYLEDIGKLVNRQLDFG